MYNDYEVELMLEEAYNEGYNDCYYSEGVKRRLNKTLNQINSLEDSSRRYHNAVRRNTFLSRPGYGHSSDPEVEAEKRAEKYERRNQMRQLSGSMREKRRKLNMGPSSYELDDVDNKKFEVNRILDAYNIGKRKLDKQRARNQ